MRRTRTIVAVVLLAIGLVAFNTYKQVQQNDELEAQDKRDEAQQQLIDGLADQLDEAAKQGADVATPEEVAETVDGAEVSAVGPQGERGPIGETGPAGEPGATPTVDQIEAAIAVYCSTRNQCREPISQADIVTAVTAYCFPDGCRGFEGALGAQGPPGEDGAPGRPPTTAEIEAAVYAYLAANPPVAGSPGPQGDTGVQGPAGEVGPAGPAGPAGVDGAPGTQGPAGVDGRTPSAMTCTETAPLSGVFDCTVTAYQ